MISRIHNKLGTAGFIVAIVALVAALGGGAYAAGGGLNGKQKKEVKKIAKKYAGKPGPRGKNGQNGINGVNGAPGAQGAKGETGAQGPKGDTGNEGPEGPAGADGIDGTNGTFSTEPLPPEETLTGVWSGYKNGTSKVNVWASFPIRVVPAPTLMVYTNAVADFGVKINPSTGQYSPPPPAIPPEAIVHGAALDALCPGSASNPTAEPGIACVYDDSLAEGLIFGNFGDATRNASPDPSSGVIFPLPGAENTTIKGSWAVTAEVAP